MTRCDRSSRTRRLEHDGLRSTADDLSTFAAGHAGLVEATLDRTRTRSGTSSATTSVSRASALALSALCWHSLQKGLDRFQATPRHRLMVSSTVTLLRRQLARATRSLARATCVEICRAIAPRRHAQRLEESRAIHGHDAPILFLLLLHHALGQRPRDRGRATRRL